MIAISVAQRYDLNAIATMEAELFSDPMGVSVMEKALDGDLFYVAKEEGNCVGYFWGQYVLDEMEILRVAVASDYWRQGIAAGLLRHAIEDADRMGVRQCFLEVREGNVGAIALYKSFGFSQRGRRPRFYRMPTEDALLMKKEWGEIK